MGSGHGESHGVNGYKCQHCFTVITDILTDVFFYHFQMGSGQVESHGVNGYKCQHCFTVITDILTDVFFGIFRWVPVMVNHTG